MAELSAAALGVPVVMVATGADLARTAKAHGISVVGGEVAQMPDTYAAGYAGIFVTVVGIEK